MCPKLELHENDSPYLKWINFIVHIKHYKNISNVLTDYTKKKKNQWCVSSSTYNVPATRVLMWVLLSGNSFERPKSESLGLKCWSKSILLALISRCTICGLTSSWIYEIAWAIPNETFRRTFQLNSVLFSSPPSN